HNNRKVGDPSWPVQQIEIEIISTETSKAPLARACDAVFRCMTRQYLGDQKYAIALTSDNPADKFLGAAVTVHFSRVDQRHPKRKTSPQRILLNRLRMSPYCELCRPLA